MGSMGKHSGTTVFGALLLLCGTASESTAEFLVSGGNRFGAAVAADADGEFVIVYSSLDQISPTHALPDDIFGKRYNSTGAAIGSEFQVNTTTIFNFDAAVAADADGDFVVVWSRSLDLFDQNDVLAQRYASSGTPAGTEFQVNTYTTGNQFDAGVAADADGNFVVVWTSDSEDGSDNGVFGQRYDSSGAPIGTEFQVNTYTTYAQEYPAVAADADGDFVVVWQCLAGCSGSDPDSGVFGQRYDSSGAPAGTEFQINTYTTGNQLNAGVAADGDGDFVVVWQSDEQDGDNLGIFGQRFGSSGAAAGSEFQVNTYTTNVQENPAVAAQADGDFVVVWGSNGLGFPGFVVVGQRYDSTGAPIGTEFQANTAPNPNNPVVAVAADGSFMVAWNRVIEIFGGGFTFYFYDVLAELYTADGVPLFPTPSATPKPTATPTPVAACGAVPDAGCTAGFGKAFLLVKESAGREKLIAKMIAGPEIPQSNFGNPLSSGGTAYRLCIYNDTPALVADELLVDRAGSSTCSGGSASCWKSIGPAPPDAGGKGYKYKDGDLAAGGVFQILLKGGTGSAGASKIIVKGRGPNLPLPIASALTTAGSVTVQLRGDDIPAPSCFSATLSDIKKQDASFFKAK